MATSAGALLALMPLPLTAAAVVWFALFGITRYVAVASIAAAWTIPLALVVIGKLRGDVQLPLLGFGLVVAGLVTFRHRSNIARLRAGTENRFERRGKRQQRDGDSGAGDDGGSGED